MKRKIIFTILFCFLFLYADSLWSQCAMCKAQAEQSIEQGSTAARWINTGILYMLVIPYLAVGILFWKWYKGYKAEEKY